MYNFSYNIDSLCLSKLITMNRKRAQKSMLKDSTWTLVCAYASIVRRRESVDLGLASHREIIAKMHFMDRFN